MRDVLLKVVDGLTIAESNCPRGARVAVVTYNSEVTTEIRFADSRKKSVLLESVRNLQVPLTSKQQSLETAMSFVARNTFKRVRSGFLMRKVAVFFSNKPTRASPQLREAVLKLSDAGITPLFLTSQEDRQLVNALQVWVRGLLASLLLPWELLSTARSPGGPASQRQRQSMALALRSARHPSRPLLTVCGSDPLVRLRASSLSPAVSVGGFPLPPKRVV